MAAGLPLTALLAACFYGLIAALSVRQPFQASDHQTQRTIEPVAQSRDSRKLTGRFLHITDIHPDPFFKVHSSTAQNQACHGGRGPAGTFGAETSDCDSPYSLVNATFKWIEENIKDDIDFIIWTGDSARHDNDERFPRTSDQIVEMNRDILRRFVDIWGTEGDGFAQRLKIPLVPTFGNNDMLPHNIFKIGPNWWTEKYVDMWHMLIPEAQRHSFIRGGWFFVEVIPNRLAVFSLNTMFFFKKNAAVDGCADPEEPGFEHMEWLRIQLEFLRLRGVKAIMTGHVPPARNKQKAHWDETCWQKYTIWMKQYRDVVVGSIYGHMNLEHFLLHDFEDIDFDVAAGLGTNEFSTIDDETPEDPPMSIELNYEKYLHAMHKWFKKLPKIPKELENFSSDGAFEDEKHKKKKRKKIDRYYQKIGGDFAERFSLSVVSASVVPNLYPTLRIMEYNISGMEDMTVASSGQALKTTTATGLEGSAGASTSMIPDSLSQLWDKVVEAFKHKKHKKKKPRFVVPKPPSTTSVPGPAYSPQALSWLGYEQYFADLTLINNDFTNDTKNPERNTEREVGELVWHSGRYSGRVPENDKPNVKDFKYQLEYDTREPNDPYQMDGDLRVSRWVDLASKLGKFRAKKGTRLSEETGMETNQKVLQSSDVYEYDQEERAEDDVDLEDEEEGESFEELDNEGLASHHKKHAHRKAVNQLWYTFASRAYVDSKTLDELVDIFAKG